MLFIESSSGGGSDKSELRILAVPDNRENCAAGCFNFINLTPNQVAIHLGGQILSLGSRESEIIQTPTDKPQNVNVQIATASSADDWRLVYQSRWGPPGNRRIWVFLHGGRDERPALKRYYEYIR